MNFKICSGAMLIAGTCVGGSMLALPVSASQVGFWGALPIIFICWLMMTAGGLYTLDLSLSLPGNPHIVSISEHYLGSKGKWLNIIIFAFVGFATIVAYLAEGGQIISDLIPMFKDTDCKPFGCSILMVLAFIILLSKKRKMLSIFNNYCFIIMLGSFFLLVPICLTQIDCNLLNIETHPFHKDGSILWPLVLASFSYPGLVTTLPRIVGTSRKDLRITVWFGTTMTLCINLLWLFCIMGSIPIEGPYGLAASYENGRSVASLMFLHYDNKYVSYLSQCFSILSIWTSFLGVSWNFILFLYDLFKVQEHSLRGYLLINSVMGVALLFSNSSKHIFFAALELTGGIGDGVISLALPAIMFSSKFVKNIKQSKQNYIIVLSVFFFGCSMILLEITRLRAFLGRFI